MPKQKDYVYAVTRVRAKEVGLLDSGTIHQLVEAKDVDSMMRVLSDKGWDTKENATEDIVSSQTDKLWELIEELKIDKDELKALMVEKDFHNLKATIKGAYAEVEVEDLYQKYGSVDIEDIKKAVKEKDFSILPQYMSEYAQQAFDVLFKTGDGQLCDSILDKAALDAMTKFASQSNLDLLKSYTSLKSAISNIKIAIRGNRTGKSRKFFERYLSKTNDLNVSSLIDVATKSEEDIYSYLSTTKFKDAIEVLKKDFATFETWCDNKIVEQIRKEKYNSFTLSPIIAYIIARQMEIKNIGILIVAKRNGFSPEEINKRMRDMYV